MKHGDDIFLQVPSGGLNEPWTGRRWDRAEVTRQFDARVRHLASRGLSVSDVVFLHHGNTPEFFVDLLAVWRLGGCAVPIDPRLTAFEVATLARTAKPRFAVGCGNVDESKAAALSGIGVRLLDSREAIRAGVAAGPLPSAGGAPAPDAPALILFTSGSTGDPKGVVHTRRTLRARWAGLRSALDLEPFRRTLCLLPTHFGHGLICNCLFPWLSGQELFILPPFKPEVILQLGNLLDENGITFLSSVPTVWRLALKTARPPRKRPLKRVFCGSAPLSAYLWKQIRDWTGTPEVFNAYGITETGSWVAGTTVPGFAPEDGLIGEPWGAEIRILKNSMDDFRPDAMRDCPPGEPGYVWIRTPALMDGYFGRDDLTRAVVRDGWFLPGDIGMTDGRGWLYLRGREGDEINKGGMKIAPADIDAVAERSGKTLDVCTFGFEDPLLGENVGIAFVLEAADDDNLRFVVNHLRRNLGKHHLPQRWYVLDEIPRTSRGKVNRSLVAQRCSGLAPVDLRRLLR